MKCGFKTLIIDRRMATVSRRLLRPELPRLPLLTRPIRLLWFLELSLRKILFPTVATKLKRRLNAQTKANRPTIPKPSILERRVGYAITISGQFAN